MKILLILSHLCLHYSIGLGENLELGATRLGKEKSILVSEDLGALWIQYRVGGD